MMKRLFALSILIALVFTAGFAFAEAADQPAPRPQEGWIKRHELFNERVKAPKVDLIFIGDSITEGWEGAGKDVWARYYTKRNAVNLGIGGDRTQHVLWRLDNGNINGISPKMAVVMIGTNNSADNTPEEITAGITAIINKLRAKLPKTKILLLSVFPREEKPGPLRAKLNQVNEQIKKLDDGKNVFLLDIGPKLMQADGSLSKEIMPDFLHLSPAGYEIWAKEIEPKVVEMMGE